MQTFEITLIFPTNGELQRTQSPTHRFEAESLEHAKRVADEMIETRSLHHRTVDTAVLTTADDHVTEITRWVRNYGWIDPAQA